MTVWHAKTRVGDGGSCDRRRVGLGNPTDIRLVGCVSNPMSKFGIGPRWFLGPVGAPKRFWCWNSDSGFISWDQLVRGVAVDPIWHFEHPWAPPHQQRSASATAPIGPAYSSIATSW